MYGVFKTAHACEGLISSGKAREGVPEGSQSTGGIGLRWYTRRVGSFNPVQRGQEGSRMKKSSRPSRPATPHDVRALGS
jgi:hypothetical protein